MPNLPRKCPSCASPLVVTQLSCTACETVITGAYPLNPFLRLTPESQQFLETFIRNRGNVKEMERVSGQSYWAIRRRLDEVIAELGFDVPPAEDDLPRRRQEILARLSQGEINVDQAAQMLIQLGEAAPKE